MNNAKINNIRMHWQENASAEEFQYMLVQFNSKTVDYGIFGDEKNSKKLPFQTLENYIPY